MAGDAQWLLVLALCMFAGSFFAGSVPLAFQLNEDHLKLVSSFGAGILVGTALIVILPEGVATLYGEGTGQCHLEGGEGGAEHEHFETERYLGAALVFGFIVMFVIDQLGPSHQHRHIAVGTIGQEYDQKPKHFKSAFLGLLVHAAADGIALGAAAIGNNPHLEMVVFFAIMLHKAPGAFGLSTFLLHEGLTRNMVRFYLAVFSTVAPVSSLLTYGLLQLYHFNTPQHIWTGLVLLFSAGSFLYVATIHVLPEITEDHHHGGHGANDRPKRGLTRLQSMFIIAGILTPLLLRVDHGH